MREIPYYSDYISENLTLYLKDSMHDVLGVKGLKHLGDMGELESSESLKFVCKLYESMKEELSSVLKQRELDRKFIDQRVKTYFKYNQSQQIDLLDPSYQTILGDEDNQGRVVVGPLVENYCGESTGQKVADIPKHLEGFHVTLFGPPDDAKLSINAMNAYHRKLKDEPAIVAEILKDNTEYPKWGADDEDSKTPLRSDLNQAALNLKGCLNKDLKYIDEKRGKNYELASDFLSQPIKRFPGLALPCSFLFYNENPIPLHIYDFALHIFEHWKNPAALTFYVPKLENEEEARYIKNMIASAEQMIKSEHPEYEIGTVRVIIVLENPRAVFRVNEIMDELYPYFVGASLGWHDYLGSTARLLKEDGNYRIPVKADPDIVIKYIKASHELLANVVGKRGGIKIGGMYGILPIDNDLHSESFQITIRGFFRDVLTQMKRNLSGYWVAHPDFIRIGIAIVCAWKKHADGDSTQLKGIINALLNDKYAREIWEFVEAKDIESLDRDDPNYARSLIVADIKESNFIANNHPDEVRYNVFQMLQYLCDWLSGNGCVALPTQINGIPARVMDDLATAERSRWEVWHEIYHGRFKVEDLIRIAHEEMNFIRRDLSDSKKIVQIKYSAENAKWYDVAMQLMLKLMTDKDPVEFATELLMPFTIPSIRLAQKPWDKVCEIEPQKYNIDEYVQRYHYYFEMCGSDKFANDNISNLACDMELVEKSIMQFDLNEVLSAASFHGDIGQTATSLDAMAKSEQALVSQDSESIKSQLMNKGKAYLDKFGFKFLVSAKGKSASELYEILNTRFDNSEEEELINAKLALLEITKKRIDAHPLSHVKKKLNNLFAQSSVKGLQLSVSAGLGQVQTLSFGKAKDGVQVDEHSMFQIASLSKTFGTAFALEFFKAKNISIETSVNSLLKEYGSKFRLTSSVEPSWADEVIVRHLVSHQALNMHYVNGVPASHDFPDLSELLNGNEKYGYPKIDIINKPGTKFNYSGAGFIVLEYLIELISKQNINECSHSFFTKLKTKNASFNHRSISQNKYAHGYKDDGQSIEDDFLLFPNFAAGMFASTADVMIFLEQLSVSYRSINNEQIISHDTAVHMSHGEDKGCQQFMSANIGLGTFIKEAADNKFYLHQGANDGFRALYLYCFDGPDRGKGFCLCANAEFNAMKLISTFAQELLRELNISGIDYSQFKENFSTENLKSEEVVNIGYKELFLDAFLPTLPEAIISKKIEMPLAKYNLLSKAMVKYVSNQKFSRFENLLSPYEPEFDPTLFGKQGKVMDSWESARHCQNEFEYALLDFSSTINTQYISVSTKYHDGNQVEFIELIADGKTLLPKTQLAAHAYLNIKLDKIVKNIQSLEIRTYPDGGLTRLSLYESVPADFEKNFVAMADATCVRFLENIPVTLKPMSIDFTDNELGYRVTMVSDEHYASANNVISPYPAINMFDGFESKRSREKNHQEYFVIEFDDEVMLKDVLFDFTYFVNNSPMFIAIEDISTESQTLLDKHFVKPYAGNIFYHEFENSKLVKKLKIIIFPDGGVNRVYFNNLN